MEEEDVSLLDYRTPKGQLIKLLELKSKKPDIDDSLGKVLDQFMQLTNDQTTFLENGIFHMNFAEDALLLQCCGVYYGKRVDKLWDELLQFHTRMVTYDETAVKNSSDRNVKEARKIELAKLEERINRRKRTRIRLCDPEVECSQNGCFIFDQNSGQDIFDRTNLLIDEQHEEEQLTLPFDCNFEIFDEWREMHLLDEIERKKKGSVVVSQYNKQKYRLKAYSLPNGNEMIYDMNDPEEFNTREGRLISVHHIRHLFEYNDRCLLPDDDFTIAKLRFAYKLKKQWMVRNKINLNAPYDTYKAEYEKYQREFLENEKRKIQNMPQRNSEDLLKFYKVLEMKEQLAKQDQEKLRKLGVNNLPEISFESLILEPLKEDYHGDYDCYLPTDGEVQPERPIQSSTDGDHEIELSQLFVDLPNLSDSIADPTAELRSDSGYFDGGFEADDESDHENNTALSTHGTDTPFEFDKDNIGNNGEQLFEKDTNELDTSDPSIQVEEGSEMRNQPESPQVDASGDQSLNTSLVNTDTSHFMENSIDNIDSSTGQLESRQDMLKEVQEFIKQGTVDEDFNFSVLENSFFKKTDDMIMILYNKENIIEDAESLNDDAQLDEIIDIGICVEKEKQRKTKLILTKNFKNQKSQKQNGIIQEKKKRKLEGGSEVPKRRKLLFKQIEKLKTSVIPPVKNDKWESFFSMNYQTEPGEGDISRLDYQSASDEEDIDELMKETNENNNDSYISGYHSDHSGSHVSDHDYCRSHTPLLPLSQDSGVGIGDTSTNSQAMNNSIEESISAEDPSLAEFNNIDLIAELSKNTGLSRNELEQTQIGKPELTDNEKQKLSAKERVAEWKDYIMPKLRKLDEHDFDIHVYGSNIMDCMNVDETKPFSDLVAGKSSAEVVRFFISSLQLANTMNVEICGAKKGELSNDSFALKLLNKERYHEHFQEYQAPSEESLYYKLEKVKQIRMKNKVMNKQTTKRKEDSCDIQTKHSQPQSIIKKSTHQSTNTNWASPPKKIKILNNNIVNMVNRQTNVNGQTTPSQLTWNYDFQQPSTSQQADLLESQKQLTSPITSPVPQTPNRISIDSGFMPSCDEDFLEQFDQLQQITEAQLQSTPVKPRKILRVSFATNTNFN